MLLIMKRTLRLVSLALIELTKGFNDITIAPSLRSKNFGRKASFTVGYVCVGQIEDHDRENNLQLSSNTLLSTKTTSALEMSSSIRLLDNMLPSSSSTLPILTPHIRQRIWICSDMSLATRAGCGINSIP